MSITSSLKVIIPTFRDTIPRMVLSPYHYSYIHVTKVTQMIVELVTQHISALHACSGNGILKPMH